MQVHVDDANRSIWSARMPILMAWARAVMKSRRHQRKPCEKRKTETTTENSIGVPS